MLRRWPARAVHTPRVALLRSFDGDFMSVSLTADGHSAVSGGVRGSIHLWNLDTGASRVLEEQRDAISSVSVTPDGRLAVSGSWDNKLRVWDLETGRSRTFEGHSDKVCSVSVTPDGLLAVSGSEDKNVRVWDLETGVSQILSGHKGQSLQRQRDTGWTTRRLRQRGHDTSSMGPRNGSIPKFGRPHDV